jgi:hypothetical protein
MKLNLIKPNPKNPRVIKDDKFEKLCKSLNEFPQMMNLRPIIIDKNLMIRGGNMRYKALQYLGYSEIPDEWIKKVEDLTEDQLKEFEIKDNLGFGEWDWDALANDWDAEKLNDWGLEVPIFNVEDYKEIEESGYNNLQQWFLNIQFDNEENCQIWYNKLIEEGLICKIIQ